MSEASNKAKADESTAGGSVGADLPVDAVIPGVDSPASDAPAADAPAPDVTTEGLIAAAVAEAEDKLKAEHQSELSALREHVSTMEQALLSAKASVGTVDAAARRITAGTAPVLTREQFDREIAEDARAIHEDAQAALALVEELKALLPAPNAKIDAPETMDGKELEAIEAVLAKVNGFDEHARATVDAVKVAREQHAERVYRSEKRLGIAEQAWREARDWMQHGTPAAARLRDRAAALLALRDAAKAKLVAAAGR